MNILSMFPGLTHNEINVIPYEARFKTAVAGDINPFTLTWDNVLSDVHDATNSTMYFISTISASVNLDKDIFLDAIDPSYNNGFINLDIISKDDLEVLNKSQIKFANYVNDRPLALAYQSRRSDGLPNGQKIQFRLSGQIKQTAAVISHLQAIGEVTLDAYISCVIYGINNPEWVEKNFLQGQK